MCLGGAAQLRAQPHPQVRSLPARRPPCGSRDSPSYAAHIGVVNDAVRAASHHDGERMIRLLTLVHALNRFDVTGLLA